MSTTERKGKDALKIDTYKNNVYRLPITESHVNNLQLKEGDFMQLKLENGDGTPVLEATPASDGLRLYYTGPGKLNLSLPKKAVIALRMDGQHFDLKSDSESLQAYIDNRRVLENVTAMNVIESEIKTWNRGYAIVIPPEIENGVDHTGNVWLWMELLNDGFMFAFETTEPENYSAIKLTINEFPENERNTDMRKYILIPAPISRLIDVGSRDLLVGHDTERILALAN